MDLVGTVVGDRFEIERAVSAGGMGMVYRARDRLRGGAVAVKVLSGAPELAARFSREVEILAGIRHPGIVRYVAHGVLSSGLPFLAMEWLEGPTLAEILDAGPLSVPESVTLAGRLAGALGAFHRRGGVHRDLKPGNVILAGGALQGATLIDFGVARLRDLGRDLTAPGVIVGTPRYMAPEQIRGSEQIDARADVFSLGCLLFRCLTGRSPFTGEEDLSFLLKILLEEAPPLQTFRKDAPPWLSALVASMLAKSPEGRPADGAAVAEALAASSPSRVEAGASGELTSDERRVLCLLLTVCPEDGGALREILARHRGRAEILPDRSFLGVFTGSGAANDLAARAARCALAAAPLLGGAPVVVVTGRAALAERLPVGDLIDRAVARLGGAGAGVRIDDVTAGLLGSHFALGADAGGPTLIAERDAAEAPRTLLGKPTPCVGRERELSRLDAALSRCAEEGEARAVLVTGPPGVGKSRLVHELLHRVRARASPVEVFLARGDPVSVGSPFGLLGQALRRAAGVLDGEPVETRRSKLQARFGREPGGRPDHVVEFLGELCGAPFPDEDSVQLRAARRDPMVMGAQMRGAFEEVLRAECAVHPVALVLEDLHWGDGPTVRAVDAALRNLRDSALFVLAAARPEVREVFPGLFRDHALDELPLRPLNRRVSEDLVREMLGEGADAVTVRDLAERADGNAFYLEELIRAVAAGRTAELPETVLSMVQTRLEGLDPEARRVLRAASIFGQRFWRGGVGALVSAAAADAWLPALAGDEMISLAREARFPGEVEYVFRHALVRDAAYGMLTADDRAVGHRLAAAWLEAAGEGDAMVLAECFERGGERGQAAVWYHRAAAQALEGNDLDLAVARAERGIACATPGSSGSPGVVDEGRLGRTYLIQAQANRWRGLHRDALERGLRAMRALPAGSAPWWDAAAEVAAAANTVPEPAELEACSATLLSTGLSARGVGDEVAVSAAVALARAAIANFYGGRYATGEALLGRSETVARGLTRDPAAAAHVDCARGVAALLKGDVSGYLSLMRSAGEAFEQAGDARSACVQTIRVGDAYLQLGVYGAAERAFRATLREAEQLVLPGQRAAAKCNLGLALALQGKIAEGIVAEEEGLALAEGDQRFELTARIYLARIVLAADPERSAREIRPISDDPGTPAAYRCYALALRAAASLALGQPEPAVLASRQAMELLASMGEIEEGSAFIHLAHVEALLASGDPGAARLASAAARARLLAQADKIADAALRRSFLERVPENARTLDLAERLSRLEP